MTRVWYEPSEGLRFAGIVVCEGTLPKTKTVLLSLHYWQWKNRGDGLRNAQQPAIATDRLTPRDSHVPHLDT